MGKNARHIEISSMLIKMGDALNKEGVELNDYRITQLSSMVLMLAGIVLNEEDTHMFSEICSMFSSKKFLDAIDMENGDLGELIEKYKNTNYDDLINKVGDMTGDDEIDEEEDEEED